MPGNGGILPDQNKFSVPVEMPEWLTSITRSPSVGAFTFSASSPKSRGPFNMTAVACKKAFPRFGFSRSHPRKTRLRHFVLTVR